MDPEARLRVAVVGAGPAGIYVTTELTGHGVSVDLYDRLPTPFGLLRYGVAPDHLKMRSLQNAIEPVLDHELVRFAGGVQVGVDVGVQELRDTYHAVVYAFGAEADKRLGIPGEDLSGSVSATQFVKWYTGHPDVPPEQFRLQARSVAVIGVGNVAIDVARVLLKDPAEWAHTDIPPQVQDELAHSAVRTVHMIGRRGPWQARFTPRELSELGTLSGVDVIVDPADLDRDQHSDQELAAAGKRTRAMVRVLSEWAARPSAGGDRKLQFHFWSRPERATGGDQVRSITVRRTRPGPDGTILDTDEVRDLPVQMVLRSVGYIGVGVEGLPVDPLSGVLANIDGRVLRDGAVSLGEYVAGWLGRGAVGVLGTNRHDAQDTVRALLADAEQLLAWAVEPADIVRRLRGQGHPVIDADGWHRIDRAEQELGRAWNRPRTKISSVEELRRAAVRGSVDRRGGSSSPAR